MIGYKQSSEPSGIRKRIGIPHSDERLIANQVFSVVSTSRGNLNIVLLR